MESKPDNSADEQRVILRQPAVVVTLHDIDYISSLCCLTAIGRGPRVSLTPHSQSTNALMSLLLVEKRFGAVQVLRVCMNAN